MARRNQSETPKPHCVLQLHPSKSTLCSQKTRSKAKTRKYRHTQTHTHTQDPRTKAKTTQKSTGSAARRNKTSKRSTSNQKKSQNQNTAKPQRKDDRDYHHHHKKTTMNSTVVAAASAVIKTSARRTIQVPKNVEQRRIAHNWMYASLSDPTLSSWDPHGHVGTVAGSTSDYHPDDSYPSMVDETLNQIFEINRLGKDEARERHAVINRESDALAFVAA